MLRAGDSSLPCHRHSRVAVSRRPRAPTPPPGLTDPSRTAGIDPKISTFCSKVNSTFCMRACAWPCLPTTPQARPSCAANQPRRNQSHRRRRPDSPQARRPATSRACARGNELMQCSRLATTLISVPPPSCNAALPPRRNASCCRPHACAGGPRG